MTPEELRAALKKADDFLDENGLGPCENLSLVMETDRPPQGYKIRTPFGNCQIMNCQEKGGKFSTVFRASRAQIVAYLKKCGIAAPT